MSRTFAFAAAGAALGFFVGSSAGVATGGTAYNAALFLVPLGAFVGWLLSKRNKALEEDTEDCGENAQLSSNILAEVVSSGCAILASIWNFQIDILKVLGLLPTFVRNPVLFVGVAIVVSVFFPPFFLVYFLAWMGALHFGISEETQFRAAVK